MLKKLGSLLAIIIMGAIFIKRASPVRNGIVELEWQAPGVPLRITVNSNAEVGVYFDTVDFATPIGVFSVDLGLESPELVGRKLLAVRIANRDIVYDLMNYQVTTIEFDPGYYSAMRLLYYNDDLIVELIQAGEFTPDPLVGTNNNSGIPITAGRVSCSDTAFRAGMVGKVLSPVSLRSDTVIPADYYSNKIGTLHEGELVDVLDVRCSEGVWLQIQRSDGQVGWAKEWGLTSDMIEKTLIAPAHP